MRGSNTESSPLFYIKCNKFEDPFTSYYLTKEGILPFLITKESFKAVTEKLRLFDSEQDAQRFADCYPKPENGTFEVERATFETEQYFRKHQKIEQRSR